MKRLVSKIGRFFWSRGFLKFILWSVTIIVLLYVEEDWRGARDWAATKVRWEAKGESLNYYGKFIPARIPDSENLAALPLFKMERDPSRGNDVYPLTWNRAMRIGREYGQGPPLSAHWQLGEVNDLVKIQREVANEYISGFKGVNPPQKPLDQFEALFPFLWDLRSAIATRPGFRMAIDYSINPPDSRSLMPLTNGIRFSQIVAIDAVLALNDNQVDVAVDDLKVNFQVTAGIKRDPTLVAGLVAIGMTSIGTGAIFDGLVHHQWSDANLVEIDHLLSPINFLSDGRFALRSEAASAVADIGYYQHSKFSVLGLLMGMGENDNVSRIQGLMVKYSPPWASGWWDQSKSQTADSILRAIYALDPEKHRAYPEISGDLQRQLDLAKLQLRSYLPWNVWATVSVGPVDGCVKKFVTAQVWVDEGRIACALERYRLAHGVYPDALDTLTPAYIEELPHDVIRGEPYHYQLLPDGSFRLYSVGWNEADDGGKTFYKDNSNTHQKVIDFDQGDWVWPTPQMGKT